MERFQAPGTASAWTSETWRAPPVENQPASDPELTCSLFQGEWPWMPDFCTLTPVSAGKSKQIELTMAFPGKPFASLFMVTSTRRKLANIRSPWIVDTDTGAMLFLHDIRVIDEPLKNSAGKFSGSIRLKAGWYPLRLYYRHATASRALSLPVRRRVANY